jgi:3-hydroxyacyl-[acyl-carrier-protein] dehydratase
MNKPKPVRRDFDTRQVMAMIPHRFPMLMIDKVIDAIGDESGTGIKNLTINEPFFAGHFPQRPVMPGVLIIEAMAQVAAVLVMSSLDMSPEGKLVYFMTIEEARFRKPVLPGDTLHVKVQKQRQVRNVWKYKGEAYVGTTLCAEATYSAMLVDDAG